MLCLLFEYHSGHHDILRLKGLSKLQCLNVNSISRNRFIIEYVAIILRVTPVIRISFVQKRKGRNKVERSALRDNNNKVKLIVLF